MTRTKAVSSIILFTVIVVTSFADRSQAQVASYSPKVGQPHADFILPSIDNGRAIAAFVASRQKGSVDALRQLVSWLSQDCARVALNDSKAQSEEPRCDWRRSGAAFRTNQAL